jgi:hypothetical protein
MTTYKKTVTTEQLDWIRVEWQDCAPKWETTCPECQERIQPGDIILIVPNAYEGYDFVHESHYE